MGIMLCIIFFLSGASALIFEAIWFQLSGLTFGNSVWAASIVLSSFMGGLALGNGITVFFGYKIKSLVRFYAILEIIIAISGLSLVLVFPFLTKLFVPIFRLFLDQVLILNIFRAATAILLMLVPATAMGMTLPILVKALYNEKPNFGKILGTLYGVNTLGAMVGVILCDIFLIKWFGIRGTGVFASIINLFIGAIAIWLSKANAVLNIETNEETTFSNLSSISGKSARILGASFFSGFTLLGLEVIWFRFMIQFFNSFSWNFAIMLAVVLAGISIGGLVISKWYELREDAHNFLQPILMLNGILLLLLYCNFDWILNIIDNIHQEYIRVTYASFFLIFPVSFFSGIVFTMIGKVMHSRVKSVTKATGLVTLANTTGGMIGALVSGYFLIPVMGIENSFFAYAIIYGLTAILVSDFRLFVSTQRKISVFRVITIGIAAFLIFALVFFPFGLMERYYSHFSYSSYTAIGENRIAYREGITETIQYLEKDILDESYFNRLVTNSHSMATTNLGSRRYMGLFAYLPIALNPEVKNALLICFGCGVTAKALTDTKRLKNIDIVDISKDIIDMSQVVFKNHMENPVHDPRVKVHIEDGRFFLLSTKRKYDLITAEPPPPKSNGIVNLYSQEYFQLIYDCLNKNGIVTYWLPVSQLEISETKSILKGFGNVFSNCMLFTGFGLDWMMVGIKNKEKPVDFDRFATQWHDPVVATKLHDIGIYYPEQMGALFIADINKIQDWVSNSLPLVDNFPRRLTKSVAYDYNKGKNVPHNNTINVYWDFMDPAISQKCFAESRQIKKIWPEALFQRTKENFNDRGILDSIFRYNWNYEKLHTCIQTPSLNKYIPWVFRSDHKAQTIISRVFHKKQLTPRELSKIYPHLAAWAVMKKDYSLAEKYLRIGMKMNKHTSKELIQLRMYLLYLDGDIKGAKKIGTEYLNQDSAGKKERREEIKVFWDELERLFDTRPLDSGV